MIIHILPRAHSCYRQMDIAIHLYHLMTNSHRVSRSACPRPLCKIILLYLSNLHTLIPPSNANTAVVQLFKYSVKINNLTVLSKYLCNVIIHVRFSATSFVVVVMLVGNSQKYFITSILLWLCLCLHNIIFY